MNVEPVIHRSLGSHGFVALGLLWAGASFAACFDWDAVDPRVAGSGAAATGGSHGGGSSAGGGGGGPCVPGSEVPCYSGPSDTRNQGICEDGTALCRADGTPGECVGDVTPQTETCEGEDENCDGQVNEPASGCVCISGELGFCYDGPAGTENHLPCQAGLAQCSPDGLSQGPCNGQVLPSIEDCANEADQNCDGDPRDHCALWSAQAGDGGRQFAYDVATDGSDNIIVVGEMEGTVDFGGGDRTSAGGRDLFVVKYDAAGNHVFSDIWGSAGNQAALAVATDGSGNIVVVGYLSATSTLDFGAAGLLTGVGGDDGFVVKLSSGGVPQWADSFGDGAFQRAHDVGVDADGAAIVVGEFAGTVDFGDGPVSTAGGRDGFVFKRSSAGVHDWTVTAGSTGDETARRVATDPSRNVLVTGEYDSSIDFGGPTLNSEGADDTYLVKLSPSGAQLWTNAVGGTGDADDPGVIVDNSGNVALYGDFTGVIDFGDGPVGSNGSEDAHLAYYDGAGALQWKLIWGDASDQDCETATFTNSGDIIVGLGHEGTVDYGGGPMVSAGADDIALVRFDGSGNYVRGRIFGDGADQDPRGLAVDSGDNLVLVGEFHGTIDFGDGPMTSAGQEDACVARFPF